MITPARLKVRWYSGPLSTATGTRREIPYGPYLSLATAAVLLFACPIIAWLSPGAEGLMIVIHETLGG